MLCASDLDTRNTQNEVSHSRFIALFLNTYVYLHACMYGLRAGMAEISATLSEVASSMMFMCIMATRLIEYMYIERHYEPMEYRRFIFMVATCLIDLPLRTYTYLFELW